LKYGDGNSKSLTTLERNMPYVRDRDFARIRELVQTIQQLAEKEGHGSIPDIANRALKIMDKYIVELEEEEKE